MSGRRNPINYVELAAALLERAHLLVPQWLPAGTERQGRWYCGDFDGGEGESANVNLRTGQWIDNGGTEDDKGGDLIALYARIHNLSNHEAAVQLMQELGWERAAPGHAPPPPPPAPRADARTEAPAKRRSMWRAITPVPPSTPAPGFLFKFHDRKADTWTELEPVRTWRYEFEGELYGYVARFERIDSKGVKVKDLMPRTWCVDETDDRGTHRWHWKQWDKPRPLYVPAGRLSADLARPVVLVEGEKCADAGHALLADEFDFVSWPGGCKAWQLAGWGWLMGRTVYLWPDCDAQREPLTKAEREAGADPNTKPLKPAHKQPGMATMVGIGTELQREHGCTVLMCQIPQPGKLGDGWDIADALEQGWDADRVRGFIRAAVAFVPPAEPGQPEPPSPPAPPAGKGGGDDDDWRPKWNRHLVRSDKGAIKPVRENVVLALDGWPDRGVEGIPEAKGVIRFNEFTNNVVKVRDTPWGTPAGDWLEADELLLGEWLVREHWLPSMARATLEEAVLMVATRHAFHPVREEFDALRGHWDGEKRLGTWLVRACMEDDEHEQQLLDYLARVGAWMVMAMVARVMQPGCKFDYMPIFEGPQGWGKSTLAKILGGDYFADTGLMLGEKDSYQNLQGVLVYEWGELDSLNKADVQKVKLFIASQKDRFRASFDRRPRDYPRQVVFVGTTNEDHYLTDPTGNRRFWPVRVTKPVDVAWLREVRDQLFAEALHYLDQGVRFHPTQKEQRELFDPQQRLREVGSAVEEALRTFLYDEDQKVPHGGVNGAYVSEISALDLLQKIGFPVEKQTAAVKKQLGQAMKRLGWQLVKATRELGGTRPYVYKRPQGGSPPSAPAQPAGSPAPTPSPSGAGAGPQVGSPQSHDTTETADACPF